MNNIDQNIYQDFQPMPLDITGWNGTSAVFSRLIEETKPEVIIEVGTWKGQSAITIAKACKALGLNTKIYCIDTWLGATEFWTFLRNTPERDLLLKNGYPQIYYQFLSNVVHSEVQDHIVPIPNTSDNGCRILDYHGIKADLIYIDASHEYEDVKRDIIQYQRLLKLNGIMFGDDWSDWKGVREAVDDVFGANIKIIDNNFWVWQK